MHINLKGMFTKYIMPAKRIFLIYLILPQAYCNGFCYENPSDHVAGRVSAEAGETRFVTCGQIAGKPEFISTVCAMEPRSEAEPFAPASQCVQTCGTGDDEESTASVLALTLRSNDKPRVFDSFTCGDIAQLNPSQISTACNLDLSIWDSFEASVVCPALCDQCGVCEDRKITAQTVDLAGTAIDDRGSSAAYFGYALAIFGDTMAVGAFAAGTGAVYIYERNVANYWQVQQKLQPSDGADNDSFGYRVQMTANEIAVTSYAINFYAGAVYLFSRNMDGTWEETQKLVDDNGGFFNNFGYGLQFAPEADILAVGGRSAGLYIYERPTILGWELVQLLPKVTSFFGDEIAISDEFIVTPGRLGDQCNIYFYSKRIAGEWSEASIVSLGDFPLINFGPKVAFFSNDIVAVGTSNGSNAEGKQTGTVHILSKSGSTWVKVQTLVAGDGQTGDRFGISVTFAGDTLVVGSMEVDNGTGAVYLFSRVVGNEWSEVEKVVAEDGEEDDVFGREISAYGSAVVIGASGDDDFLGSVYVTQMDCVNGNDN